MSDYDNISGVLSDEDIEHCIENKKMVIWPYEKENNLTSVGYNLTATEFIFSINNRLLVDIINDNKQKYCYIEPHDTVLILTREAIWVCDELCGTFHSKVGIVSQGFGHISTTLDPNWQGPLLISLNNPTNNKLKFLISKIEDNKGDTNPNLIFKHCSFVTLIFYKLNTKTHKMHDNESCRFDLLKDIIKRPKKKFLNKIFRRKKNDKQYEELREFVNNIGNLDFIKLGVKPKHGLQNKLIDTEEFKKRYQQMIETINLFTDSAHQINKKIIRKESRKRLAKNIYPVIPLIIISFIIWRLINQEGRNGSLMLQYIIFIVSIVPMYYKLIYNKKESK